jgi:hypothetical protein
VIATLTTADLATRLRCSERKVRKAAATLGIGVDLGGRAGYRYTEAEADALWESLRPVQTVERRRRRRSA